jgi:hypothetical protein
MKGLLCALPLRFPLVFLIAASALIGTLAPMAPLVFLSAWRLPLWVPVLDATVRILRLVAGLALSCLGWLSLTALTGLLTRIVLTKLLFT